MNRLAEKHLDKADKLLARGDGFYAQAADEIIAAKAVDTSLTNAQIGERFDRGKDWVSTLVRWRASGVTSSTPFAGDGKPRHQDVVATRKLLREAPMEQVEQMISALPKDRQQQIAAAADPQGYAAARVAENERVSSQTPAERKEIEAAKEAMGQPVRQAVASFTALGVVGHLEQATEDLGEMISSQTVSVESLYRIKQAHDLFVTELQVAQAMVGLERSEA